MTHRLPALGDVAALVAVGDEGMKLGDHAGAGACDIWRADHPLLWPVGFAAAEAKLKLSNEVVLIFHPFAFESGLTSGFMHCSGESGKVQHRRLVGSLLFSRMDFL
jgi:hypothetical protein